MQGGRQPAPPTPPASAGMDYPAAGPGGAERREEVAMRSGAGLGWVLPGSPQEGGPCGALLSVGRPWERAELASLAGTVPSPPYRLREAGGRDGSSEER